MAIKTETTEWPEKCPIGRSATGVTSNRKMSEPQAHIVMLCDWDATEQTKMPYDRAEELRAEIACRWAAHGPLVAALEAILAVHAERLPHDRPTSINITDRIEMIARAALAKAGA